MWEEDPRWQDANYRFVLWSVAGIGALSLFRSLLASELSYLRSFCIGLGVLLDALCVYVAILRTTALLITLSVRLSRRFHRHDNA